MNVALTPAQKRFVAEKVEAGQFATAADVIRAAIESFQAQERMTPQDIADLRAAAAIGIRELDRGETADFTATDIKALGRQVLARRKGAAIRAKRIGNGGR